MIDREQKAAAKAFSEKWLAKEGYEKGETQQFWSDLLDDTLRRQIYGNSPSRVNKSLNDVLQPNKKTRYTSMDSSTGIFNAAGFTCHENYNLEFEHFVPSQLHDAISHTGGASHLVSEISHIKNITHLFVRSGVSTGVNMLADGEKALRSALFD